MMDWRPVLLILISLAGCASPASPPPEPAVERNPWLAGLLDSDVAIREETVRQMLALGESGRAPAEELAAHRDPEVAARARSVLSELDKRPSSYTLQMERAIRDCRGSYLQLLWLGSRVGERTLCERGVKEVLRALEFQGWTPVERLFGERAILRLRTIDISPAENLKAELRVWIFCDQDGQGDDSAIRPVWAAYPELVLQVAGKFEEFRKTVRARPDSLLAMSLADEDLESAGQGFPKMEEAGISCHLVSEHRGDRTWRSFHLRFDLASEDGRSGTRMLSSVDSTLDPSAESFLDANGNAPKLKAPSGFSGPSWTKH